MLQHSFSNRNFLFAAVLLAVGCENGAVHESPSSPSALDELVASNDQTPPPIATADEALSTFEMPTIAVDTPTQDRPVTAAMVCQKMSENADTVTINVCIKLLIARGHYIYAPADTEGPFRTLEVQLQSDNVRINDGDWTYPISKPKNGNAVYFDSVAIHRQLRLTADAASSVEASVHFQVCNEDVCYPPSTLKLVGSFDRVP